MLIVLGREMSYIHSSVYQITIGNKFTFSSLNWSRNLAWRVVLVERRINIPSLQCPVLGVGHYIVGQGGAGQHDWFQCC